MAIKKQVNNKKAVPKKRRVTVRTEAVSAPIYSVDEKRQLILAHAAMRKPHDPIQMMSAWAGVAVIAVVVAMGWWWSSETLFTKGIDQIGSKTGQLLTDASKTKQNIKPDFSTLMEKTTEQLKVLETQTSQRNEAIDTMATLISTSGSSTNRQDIFQHNATTSSN